MGDISSFTSPEDMTIPSLPEELVKKIPPEMANSLWISFEENMKKLQKLKQI